MEEQKEQKEGMEVRKRGKEVSKIVIHYDDGSTKEITKGMTVVDESNGGEHSLTFEFVGTNGVDVANLIFGVTEMGVNFGLFDDEEDEENNG